jgi:hypothetical protein
MLTWNAGRLALLEPTATDGGLVTCRVARETILAMRIYSEIIGHAAEDRRETYLF